MAIRFDNLLDPISGDSPAGDARLYSRQLRDSFATLRKPEQPSSEADTNYRRTADWNSLEKFAQSALSEQTKDIRIACHLVEAWTQIRGFSGLYDGLLLLTRFVEDCWERSNPTIEDQDFDTRLSPLENMLDDVDRGFCFPLTIRSIQLLGDENQGCDYFLFQELHQSKDEKQQRTLKQIIDASSPARLWQVSDDIEKSLSQLNSLKSALELHVGQQTPGFTYLRDAISDCQRIVAVYAPPRSVDTDNTTEGLSAPKSTTTTEVNRATDNSKTVNTEIVDGNELEGSEVDGNETDAIHSLPPAKSINNPQAVASTSLPTLNSRKAAYQMLEQVAEYLKQAEPHSPVPYLIERAVSLGQMPFPILAQQMIREEGILSDLKREFGFQTHTAAMQDS